MDGGLAIAAFLVFTGATAALINWLVYCYRSASWRKTFFKTISVTLLAGASLLLQGPWWLTAALAACALGDFLLALDREKAFLAGVGAFALGHVFYVFAMLGHRMSDVSRLLETPQFWFLIALICLAIGMMIVLFRKAGDLRFAVLAYVPVIAAMGVSALTLPMIGPLELAAFGALLFVISDFTLALEMFVLREGATLRKVTPFLVWVTYWCAQLLLLAGLGLPVK